MWTIIFTTILLHPYSVEYKTETATGFATFAQCEEKANLLNNIKIDSPGSMGEPTRRRIMALCMEVPK